jgi:hypothetical protein
VNSRIREIKESFTADIEHDKYGAQKEVRKLIRLTKQEVNEFITNNKITIGNVRTSFLDCTGHNL